jgi:hypothetical protein
MGGVAIGVGSCFNGFNEVTMGGKETSREGVTWLKETMMGGKLTPVVVLLDPGMIVIFVVLLCTVAPTSNSSP